MRSDIKLRDTVKPIRPSSNGQIFLKNANPAAPIAQNPKVSPFQTPSKAVKVYQSDQKTQKNSESSFIQYSTQDNNYDLQDHDQTVLSFLRTMDVQNVQLLKQSLRHGEKFMHQRVPSQSDLKSQQNISRQKKNNCQEFMKNLEAQIINKLVQQIQIMPPDQYTQLLSVLDEIEQGKHNDQYLLKLYNQKQDSIVDASTQAKPRKAKQMNSVQTIRMEQQILVIRILSNHGNIQFVGLTELQIYDPNLQLIPVNVLDIECSSQPQTIQRVLDGHSFTISDEHMWCTKYQRFPIDIKIKLAADAVIGSIKIWNYNQNVIQLSTGIKMVEILLNDNTLWSGDIRKGSGSMYDDYSHSIIIPKTQLISTDRRFISPSKPPLFTPKQAIMNFTQNSYQSQQTKKSEESCGLNRETFISNTSNNLSKISQSRTYKHPKLACNLFDEQNSHSHKTPIGKQLKDSEHFKVFSESNLMQRPFKQITQRTNLIKFPIELKPPQQLLLNNLFPSKNTQLQQVKPAELTHQKPVKVMYRKHIV